MLPLVSGGFKQGAQWEEARLQLRGLGSVRLPARLPGSWPTPLRTRLGPTCVRFLQSWGFWLQRQERICKHRAWQGKAFLGFESLLAEATDTVRVKLVEL